MIKFLQSAVLVTASKPDPQRGIALLRRENDDTSKKTKASYTRNPCAYLNFLFFITEIQG